MEARALPFLLFYLGQLADAPSPLAVSLALKLV
jgi:hypothetical protein